MQDASQIPSLALIAAMIVAFGYLHRRFRSVRTLLWLLALGCAEIQGILLWIVAHQAAMPGAATTTNTLWMKATAEAALLLSSALLLASLSPLSFKIGRFRILYVVPYLLPLLLYSILYYGVGPYLLGLRFGLQSLGAPAVANHVTVATAASSEVVSGLMLGVYALLGLWAAAVAFLWSLQKGAIPIWLAAAIVSIGSAVCIPSFLHGNVFWPLLIVESGNMLMAALLVIYHYRRLSPGVFLAVGGFAAWALLPLRYFPEILSFTRPILEPIQGTASSPGWIAIALAYTVVLGRVILAVGLLLLVLEDQLEINETAQKRELSVRVELEAYARQALTARSLEEFDRFSTQLCSMITEQSCFSAAAILVRSASGGFALTGYAGIDGATAGALDAVAHRMSPNSFAEHGEPITADSASCHLDLNPWLTPGDDLERLHLTRVCAIPMLGPANSTHSSNSADSAEGALLLIGPRIPLETLRPDDLLPLGILAGRLQAARAQAMMLGKLIESERFAGVGQLATNVAHQLNNPLTVILGYAALLEEAGLPGPEQRGAEAINVEARRMKSILERLSRFSRLSSDRFNAFSVADLIADIEQLHRTDFLRHSIEFRVLVAPGLQPIFGNHHQIRQALLHATQFAIDAVQRINPNQEKSIYIEVTPEEGRVRIAIAHSGQGFTHPERAFDSLATGFTTNESSGIGLSLCAAIIREHRGTITAANLQPTGATIQIELPLS